MDKIRLSRRDVVSRWVFVEERLPKAGEVVVARTATGKTVPAKYDPDTDRWIDLSSFLGIRVLPKVVKFFRIPQAPRSR